MNTVMEKPSKDEMSQEVCNFAHALLKGGDCPLLVVQALIAGTLEFAGKIGEEAMRGHIAQVDHVNYLFQQYDLQRSYEENSKRPRDDIPF